MICMAIYYLKAPHFSYNIPIDVLKWSKFNYITCDGIVLLLGICLYLSNFESYIRSLIIGLIIYQLTIVSYDIFLFFQPCTKFIEYCNSTNLAYCLYVIIIIVIVGFIVNTIKNRKYE
jgi:hypothetical protein